MRYPFRVYQTQVEKHAFWIAESPALKGCVGQGETPEEAIKELETNEQNWLQLAEEYGIKIPEIPMEELSTYSGKLTLRVAPYVHQEASELAKKQGVSLNQYINDAIIAQNARISTAGYIVPEVRQAIRLVRELISASSKSYTKGMEDTMRYYTGRKAEQSITVFFSDEIKQYAV